MKVELSDLGSALVNHGDFRRRTSVFQSQLIYLPYPVSIKGYDVVYINPGVPTSFLDAALRTFIIEISMGSWHSPIREKKDSPKKNLTLKITLILTIKNTFCLEEGFFWDGSFSLVLSELV